MDILLLLSSTYWQLARMEDAAEVLKRVLDACMNVRVNNSREAYQWGVQTGAMLNASLYHQIILLQHHHAGAIVSFQQGSQAVASVSDLQILFKNASATYCMERDIMTHAFRAWLTHGSKSSPPGLISSKSLQVSRMTTIFFPILHSLGFINDFSNRNCILSLRIVNPRLLPLSEKTR